MLALVNLRIGLRVDWVESAILMNRNGGSDSGSDEDDTLIQAAQNGDRAAFALLLRRHREWVFRLLHAIIQDGDRAEDLTQEVFWRVYLRLGDYIPCGKFAPYLKRVAVNAARNSLRDRRCQARREIPIEEMVLGTEGGRLTDPAAILSSRLLQEEVRTAIETLSEEQRQVVTLYYFGGRSVESIADTLCCPVGTVKSRLFHGRRHLRRALQETEEKNTEAQHENERNSVS